MEVDRLVLVVVDLLGAVAAVSGDIPNATSIATSSACSASDAGAGTTRRSTCTSESICSLAVVTEVYSPSAIEKAPASSPATPLITTVLRVRTGGHPRDQRGVADQPVHRTERRGAQPPAGHVGVPVIDHGTCGSPSESVMAMIQRGPGGVGNAGMVTVCDITVCATVLRATVEV